MKNNITFRKETHKTRYGTYNVYINYQHGVTLQQIGIAWEVYKEGRYVSGFGLLKDAREYAKLLVSDGMQAAEKFARSVMIRNGAKIATN